MKKSFLKQQKDICIMNMSSMCIFSSLDWDLNMMEKIKSLPTNIIHIDVGVINWMKVYKKQTEKCMGI